MPFYRRNLPHLQFRGGEYFVTFRLFGSIPTKIIKEIKSYRKEFQNQLKNGTDGNFKNELERKIFLRYKSSVDQGITGPHWLKQKYVARIVENSIHYRDNKEYDLYAYCIMSNHVHIVFRHIERDNKIENKHISKPQESEDFPITKMLANLKKYTARNCNKVLKRSGSFWQAENYDRLIRNDEELENCIHYTLNNPVKANLVANWRQWPYSYCKEEFLDSLR